MLIIATCILVGPSCVCTLKVRKVEKKSNKNRKLRAGFLNFDYKLNYSTRGYAPILYDFNLLKAFGLNILFCSKIERVWAKAMEQNSRKAQQGNGRTFGKN